MLGPEQFDQSQHDVGAQVKRNRRDGMRVSSVLSRFPRIFVISVLAP